MSESAPALDVLLIEDNPLHAEIIERSLEVPDRTVNLTTVTRLAEAQAILDKRVPDIVLVDYVLPDGVGTEVLSDGLPFPVVVITSHGDEDLAVEAIKTGAVDFVRKDSGGLRQVSRTVTRTLREWELIEARRAQQRRVESLNARLMAMFGADAGVAMIAVTPTGAIDWFNHSAERMLARRSADVVASSALLDFFAPEHRAVLEKQLGNGGFTGVIDALRTASTDWRWLDENGREFPVSLGISEILVGSNVDGFLITAADLSGRVKAERERADNQRRLAYAQKIEALGALAGGLAHDFNNILAAMITMATESELALDSRPDLREIKQNQSEIIAAGYRAAELVAQLRTFARPDRSHRGASEVKTAIRDALALVKPNIGRGVELHSTLPADQLWAGINAVSLQQVLLNLTMNADRAMDRHGHIYIDAALQEVSNARCESCDCAFGGQLVRIRVRDSGPGVAPERRAQIFTPFHSDTGSSGLGLSVVHGIVHSVDGHLTIDDAGGACFTVYLPLAARPSHAPEKPAPPVVPPSSHDILVVDDEPAVLRAVSRLFSVLGHRVTAVASAQEALDRVKAQPRRFRLILTDEKLPGMTGMELSRALSDICPDVPIVLSSGDSSIHSNTEAAELGLAGFLPKPYGLKELEQLLSRLPS